MNLKDKLAGITDNSAPDWKEEAEKREKNSSARRKAGLVALEVLEALDKQNLTQAELARKMGVTRQQVTKIVKGQENFTFETIDKLEQALGITLITIGTQKVPLAPEPLPVVILPFSEGIKRIDSTGFYTEVRRPARIKDCILFWRHYFDYSISNGNCFIEINRWSVNRKHVPFVFERQNFHSLTLSKISECAYSCVGTDISSWKGEMRMTLKDGESYQTSKKYEGIENF